MIQILTVSLLNREMQKNIRGLLLYIKLLSIRRQDFVVHIVGDGPDRLTLQELANFYGIDNFVRFLGYVSENEKKREFKECDFYVQSSRYETFGIGPVEAMVYGKPVVSTACGSEEFIPEYAGIVVPVGDTVAFVDAMDCMISYLLRRK